MNPSARTSNSLLNYFLLVFVLAVPFWLFGGGKLPLPINLPVGALVTFVPMIAASILSYQQSGFTGVKELLKKAVDYKKIKNRVWYLPALFLQPLIYFLSYVVMRLAGLPLPDPIDIPLLIAPVFFVMFFIGDAGEELGWSGYAIDPMQNRWGALTASFILGVVWATWHAIPFVQTGNAPNWIVWQSLSAIAIRILIVWLYNNTGKSVFAAILFHDMTNVSWSLFPNYGSHYDPFVTGLITWLTVLIVIVGSRARRPAAHRLSLQTSGGKIGNNNSTRECWHGSLIRGDKEDLYAGIRLFIRRGKYGGVRNGGAVFRRDRGAEGSDRIPWPKRRPQRNRPHVWRANGDRHWSDPGWPGVAGDLPE